MVRIKSNKSINKRNLVFTTTLRIELGMRMETGFFLSSQIGNKPSIGVRCTLHSEMSTRRNQINRSLLNFMTKCIPRNHSSINQNEWKLHFRRPFRLCVAIHQRSRGMCHVFRMNLFVSFYFGGAGVFDVKKIDCIRTSIRTSRHFIIESLGFFFRPAAKPNRENMDGITAEIRFDRYGVIQHQNTFNKL